MKFALRGNKSPQLSAAFARGPLEIKGCFHAQGCQIVGSEEGECPQWIADFFEANPDVTQLAIGTKTDGVVYAPLLRENVKVMATPLAGASVGRGVEVKITVKHREQRG